MPQTQHLLVPTDFSEMSIEAIRTAYELAFPATEITLLHVYDPTNLSGPTTRDIVLFPQGVPKEVERWIMENLYSVSQDHMKKSVKTNLEYVLSQDPAEAICDYARKNMVDLIVLTTHGRTGLSHLFMGSVAEEVVRKAKCPVLIARSRSKHIQKNTTPIEATHT